MKRDLDNILAEKGADALLLYSESFKSVNMYYLTGFLAPDPFILLKKLGSEPTILVNPMELPRAQKESMVKDVRSYAEYNYLEVIKAAENPKIGAMNFLASVAKKELGEERVIGVPHDFPAVAVDMLRAKDLNIRPMFDVIEKARETKEPEEVDEIRKVQRVVEKVAGEAIDMIANCEIGSDKTLIHKTEGRKEPLTVERVKSFMGHRFLDHGLAAEEEVIVACGPRSADPHYFGDPQDELKANQPIVMDIYPRSVRRRYWTDMTRTVVKGRASNEVRRMFNAVVEAKETCTDALREGVPGSDMFHLCCDVLEKAGYDTIRGGKQIKKGFIHNLGHGVGLEIHEEPSMSEVHMFPLREHSVVTVEPGLYDPRVGGVRIEDLVELKKDGCNNLTKMEATLEI